jgi:hypothetical protein
VKDFEVEMAQLIEFLNSDDLPTVVNLDEVRYAHFVDRGTSGVTSIFSSTKTEEA